MKSNPEISIIVPTYNREILLPFTLESIFSQTYKDYEIIIVDDGSTDSTRVLISNLINDRSERIRYFYQSNSGCGAARRKGVHESSGKYLTILDSDDLWLPFFLEILHAKIEKNPEFGMVYSGILDYDSNKKSLTNVNFKGKSGNLLYEMVFKKLHICHGQSLIRKSCIDKVGNFNSKLRMLEDREFNYRMSKEFNFLYVDYPLFIDRKHGIGNKPIPKGAGSKVITYSEQINKYERFFLHSLLNDKHLHKKYIFFQRRILSNSVKSWGLHFFVRGELKKAQSFFIKSILLYPLNLISFMFLFASFMGIYNKRKSKTINDIEASNI